MADTSAGGCVRSATRSLASTRSWASVSGAGSCTSGFASASTRTSASATSITATGLLLGSVGSRFAAALLDKPDGLDAHAALDRLHHVIDGEAGNRHRRQRLHLDPRLAGDLDGSPHGEAGQLPVG